LAFFNAYEGVRKLTASEIEAFSILARGASLRFALTRLVDWLNVPADALVHPRTRSNISTNCASPDNHQHARTWFVAVNGLVAIWTDGACSGNPGLEAGAPSSPAGAMSKNLWW